LMHVARRVRGSKKKGERWKQNQRKREG
jgi:hypothetical protein